MVGLVSIGGLGPTLAETLYKVRTIWRTSQGPPRRREAQRLKEATDQETKIFTFGTEETANCETSTEEGEETETRSRDIKVVELVRASFYD